MTLKVVKKKFNTRLLASLRHKPVVMKKGKSSAQNLSDDLAISDDFFIKNFKKMNFIEQKSGIRRKFFIGWVVF